MENQHRKITGYRELNQDEIDAMNRIKEEGARLEALMYSCGADANDAEAMRWRAIAKTHFQQGLMALTRSVAKPEFF